MHEKPSLFRWITRWSAGELVSEGAAILRPCKAEARGLGPMCQYDSRCDVGHHKPTTICPYQRRHGRSTGNNGTPNYSASRSSNGTATSVAPAGANRAGAVDRSPQLWGGLSVIDLLFLLLLLSRWDGTWTVWTIVIGLLVLLPFLIGWDLLSKCRAWLNDGTRRCEQPRKGFLHRCFDHRSQALTVYDAAGGLSLAVGCFNAVAALSALAQSQ